MLQLRHLAYGHPNGTLLFKDLDFTLTYGLHGLTGPNGTGKSTLLQLITGELKESNGYIVREQTPYYAPQHYGQLDQMSVAEILKIDKPLKALKAILTGDTLEQHFTDLADQWDLEQTVHKAFSRWGLAGIRTESSFGSLSGGMKTKVLLSGITIHQPRCLLLDEPTNHLDGQGRRLLYELLENYKGAALIVSHDRALLDKMHAISVLNKEGLTTYGGNYSFYVEQRLNEKNAQQQQLKATAKSLKNATAIQRQMEQRKQKLDSRGKVKQQKAGLPTILQHTLKNKAENSTAKLKASHAEKITGLKSTFQALREQVKTNTGMRLALAHSDTHRGKLLFQARDLNFNYPEGKTSIWPIALNFSMFSGQRWAVTGSNGSGKSTLMELIQKNIQPQSGSLFTTDPVILHLDQHYKMIDPKLSVMEQAMLYKHPATLPDEVRIVLTRFLFIPDCWDKSCRSLSGGERMRLALCCLNLKKAPADLLLLDEPTNNLDLDNLAILTEVVAAYTGSLLVCSHDPHFLKEIGVTHTLLVEKGGQLDSFEPPLS